MRSWPTLVLSGAAGAAAAVEDWLLESASEPGSGFRGARLEAGPEPFRLVISFADADGRDRLAAAARAAFPVLQATCCEEPDRDWVAEVAATEVAVPLGRRFAALPGAASALPGREGIRVPRSRAFGTGEHASTRLAAALLEERLTPGAGLLDLGTGTGLLAVLGKKLGAGQVLAVDLDPEACEVARQTLAAAGEEIGLVVGTASCLRPGRPFGTIVANIERDVLIAMMPDLLRLLRPGGAMVLAGLLVEQVDEVAAAALRFDAVELERRQEAEWGALVLTRRPASRPRSLCPGAAPDEEAAVELPETEAHHLIRVRRLVEGDVVEVVDGAGAAWFGRLSAASGRWRVEACRPLAAATEPALAITLAAAVLDEAGRMEALLRHAVELGVAAVQPVLTERCQGRRSRRGWPLSRWQRVVAESVKQSGRVKVPHVAEPVDLADLQPAPGMTGLFLDPAGLDPETLRLRQAPGAALLLVGPEGGLTSQECAGLRSAGWIPLRLGPRILRSETAAAAGLCAVLSAWGDWRGGLS